MQRRYQDSEYRAFHKWKEDIQLHLNNCMTFSSIWHRAVYFVTDIAFWIYTLTVLFHVCQFGLFVPNSQRSFKKAVDKINWELLVEKSIHNWSKAQSKTDM